MCSDSTSSTRPSGARWLSPGTISPSKARLVTAKTSPSRLDSVSSGPNSRKFDGLALITSRSQPPSTLVGSDSPVPGACTATA
jgi:hypothetical protein